MNIATEAYGTGAAIDSLYSQLTRLEARYGKELASEGVTQEVAILKASIEECRKGSPEAADFLSEHGGELLLDIKKRMRAAAFRRVQQQLHAEENHTLSYYSITTRALRDVKRAAAIANDAYARVPELHREIRS